MRILVIEDDQTVAELMRRMLADEGYAVDVAHDGEHGRSMAKDDSYDAIVLDLELPDRNGMSVLQELRREGSRTPIVVSTGRSTPADVVRVLDAGADDYVQKPVPNEVLAARIRAAVRRGGTPQMDRVTVGDLAINRLTHEVHCNGKPVTLTARQYALLEYLAMRIGEVVRRSELLEHVWKLSFDPGSNVVDVHVAQLRKRLREAGSTVDIRTARGMGYALEA
jgi:DNA-binding response OmpR family regulator